LNCGTVILLYINEFGIQCFLIFVLKNLNFATLINRGEDKCIIFGPISVTVVVCRSIGHVLWMCLNAAVIPFIETAFRVTELLDTVSITQTIKFLYKIYFHIRYSFEHNLPASSSFFSSSTSTVATRISKSSSSDTWKRSSIKSMHFSGSTLSQFIWLLSPAMAATFSSFLGRGRYPPTPLLQILWLCF